MSQRRPRAGIRPARRLLTCYHEAGHCLARWWFGHSFDRVLVLTTDEVARVAQALNHRGVLTAGAEGFMDGYDLKSSLTLDMLDGMGGDPDLVSQFRRVTLVSAEMDLIENYIGAASEARYRKRSVTAAMLTGGAENLAQAGRTLNTWYPNPNARRTARIQATQRAAALVRSEAGWRAITALATTLMKRGEVKWIEAEPLLAAAYGHKQPDPNAWLAAWPPSLGMIRNGQLPK
jgi:hypothetical protein